MTAATTGGPVRIDARLDEHLSRWLWLVKWVLVIPHLIVLAPLWVAFAVLSVVAFVAILATGRYPESIFEFTTGVLRWTWRVAYYAYGALGTDRYPPFTLGEVPDYPATLHITRPEHLSRGLVLVKWLLALPHYLITAFFVGGGTYAVWRLGESSSQAGSWSTTAAGGLIGLLVLIAGIALLFTGRYPRGVFDLVLGMHRWVLRVVAYAALMTDAYPPFRLDTGGTDPASITVTGAGPIDTPAPTAPTGTSVAPPPPTPPTHGWNAGRVVSVVVGSVLVAAALGMAVGGGTLLAADRVGRDADGFLSTPDRWFTSPGHALQFDAVDLVPADGSQVRYVDPASLLGVVRVRAAARDGTVFVGIGPAEDVRSYLGGVGRDVIGGPAADARRTTWVPGGAPATAPGAQDFWAASVSGPGVQQLTWTAVDGRWAVVVMNADGSRPVDARVSGGATVPGLHWVWTGLFIGAGATLLAGALLVGLAVPRRPVG
ncbi:DUF4389 domain-containing protein [Pseudonocardia lacus]|uniref:DUF4389 domain-containing protein n=1 Tax=Pseudonocardia lacus TaxID=2835865 RepID=UPI001BDD5F3C|nr:DUF4389 domain-containing protein [Pseudonocardia lacus]